MKVNSIKVLGLLILLAVFFSSGGCISNDNETILSKPGILATLFWQESTQKPQVQVLVRATHYRVLTGYASLLGRRYYGSTVLKSEAATYHEDWKERPLESVVGDELSLCDVYFVVDRAEPMMAVEIYLRTEVSCEIILSGFFGQLREKRASRRYEEPFIFGPGTYHLQTLREK